jgi:GntP family gluconate:H+ symporter
VTAPGHEIRLLIAAVLAIAGVVTAIGRFKINAFPALLVAALSMGLIAGLEPVKVTTAMTTGFGQILGGVAPVLGLGGILGALVLGSGGAERIASAMLGACGPRGACWMIAGVAMLIGAPLFFETGLILLMPVIIALGQRLEHEGLGRPGSGYVRAGIPALAGLSVMHGLVAPHPGPLIAINALEAPLGRTFLIGLAMALPTVIIAGPLFGGWVARFAGASPPQAAAPVDDEDSQTRSAGLWATLFTLLLPGLLILAKTIADLDLAPASPFRGLADALGAPTIALLAAVLVGTFTLGAALGLTRDAIAHRVASGLPAMAAILLVIGAGGAFKQVLVDSGIGAALASAAALAHLSPLVVGWLLAVTIRLATGSATVATTTAAGVMAAAVQGTSVDRSLLALSIGGGSLFFSHVNDAGFWMVRELLGLSVADTFKTWSVMETLISLAVLGLVLAASVVL